MLVKTTGQPQKRGFNKTRGNWPWLPAPLSSSASGFQPVSNCSLISLSQEALTLCSQLQGGWPVLQHRLLRSASGQGYLAPFPWILSQHKVGAGERVQNRYSQVRGEGIQLAPTCSHTPWALQLSTEAKSKRIGMI